MSSNKAQTEVVIVGGGVAALEAALALRARADGLVRTTLLAPNTQFSYRPARVGEPFGHAAAQTFSMQQIASDIGIDRHADSLKWVDTVERVVHTDQGTALSYDALLLAVGARTYPSLPHAVTLDPERLDDQLHGVVQDVDGGHLRSVAFVIPSIYAWPLPAYELALMTATRAYEMNVELAVTLVTPEDAPLAVFGSAVTKELQQLLDRRHINLIASSHCVMREAGRLTVHPSGREVTADQIIALPELRGPALPGIRRNASRGFISTDRYGRVTGVERVFAAGDLTDFPIKHGGIAAQQADAAADSIAELAGANIVPQPFVPTLRGLLWAGDRSLYLQARVTGTHGSISSLAMEPTLSGAAKIDARYLGPYLASLNYVNGTAATAA